MKNVIVESKKLTANSFINIGFIYENQGDIPMALEYWYRSLKIYEEIGDKLGIATSLNNIGNIYENQGDMINAIDYYLKSIIVRTM